MSFDKDGTDGMIRMLHVVLYLRKLIREHDRDKEANLMEETAYASVPEALYVF